MVFIKYIKIILNLKPHERIRAVAGGLYGFASYVNCPIYRGVNMMKKQLVDNGNDNSNSNGNDDNNDSTIYD